MQISEEGALLSVDKPFGWTSFDVVKKLKYGLKVKKIGHAGTLDPLATGLLLIGIGKQTKQLHGLQGLNKTYEGTLVLGKTTPSYDLETEFDQITDISHLTPEMVQSVIDVFKGEQQQYPPAHSAVKVDGERAYKKARRNEVVVINPRIIQIFDLHFTEIKIPEVHFTVTCSKGTYIRSLAHDIGKHLGVGAHLSALKRTAIGDYQLKDAQTIDEIIRPEAL